MKFEPSENVDLIIVNYWFERWSFIFHGTDRMPSVILVKTVTRIIHENRHIIYSCIQMRQPVGLRIIALSATQYLAKIIPTSED